MSLIRLQSSSLIMIFENLLLTAQKNEWKNKESKGKNCARAEYHFPYNLKILCEFSFADG